MKLKITSDGTTRGTRVETLTGARLENVTKVTWELEAGSRRTTAVITLTGLPVELTADAVVWEPLR